MKIESGLGREIDFKPSGKLLWLYHITNLPLSQYKITNKLR